MYFGLDDCTQVHLKCFEEATILELVLILITARALLAVSLYFIHVFDLEALSLYVQTRHTLWSPGQE